MCNTSAGSHLERGTTGSPLFYRINLNFFFQSIEFFAHSMISFRNFDLVIVHACVLKRHEEAHAAVNQLPICFFIASSRPFYFPRFIQIGQFFASNENWMEYLWEWSRRCRQSCTIDMTISVLSKRCLLRALNRGEGHCQNEPVTAWITKTKLVALSLLSPFSRLSLCSLLEVLFGIALCMYFGCPNRGQWQASAIDVDSGLAVGHFCIHFECMHIA